MGFLAALLTACGGSGSEAPAAPPAPTAVPAGQVAQQTLGPAGGTVTLASSDGAVFALSLPAGALAADVTVAPAIAEATPSQRFHLQLSPPGTVLAAGQTATRTIALPAGVATPGALFYDGVPIPFTALPDGRLQVQLNRFVGAAAATLAHRMRAPFARALANGGTAACSGIPQLGNAEEGGLTAGDAVAVEVYGQCMVDAVNRLAASGDFEDAVRLARAGQRTVTRVHSLQPSPALRQTVDQEITQRAQPGLLDAMLQAPWQRCRDSGEFDTLIELMEILGRPQAVKTAAQYCATQLTAQARNSVGAVTATLDPALGGVAAGQHWPMADGSHSLHGVPDGSGWLLHIRPSSHADRLSARESEIARHFAAGMGYKEVAQHTGLAPTTVRNHLRNVYAKLGIANRAALVVAMQ